MLAYLKRSTLFQKAKNGFFFILLRFFLNIRIKSRHKKQKKGAKNEDIGLTSVINHQSVDRFIASIFSFFDVTNTELPIFLINDGSLTSGDLQKLKRAFLNIIIISTKSSKKKIAYRLKQYPNLIKFRFHPETTPLKVKMDAILLCPFKRYVYIDSDILFFKPPTEIITFLLKKRGRNFYSHRATPTKKQFDVSWSEEHDYETVVRGLFLQFYPNKISLFFNSGLLGIDQKTFLNLHKMNSLAAFFFENGYYSAWLAEETLFSFGFSDSSDNALNPHAYVNISNPTEYRKIKIKKITSLHYSGDSGLKERFNRDAVIIMAKKIIQTYFFRITNSSNSISFK